MLEVFSEAKDLAIRTLAGEYGDDFDEAKIKTYISYCEDKISTLETRNSELLGYDTIVSLLEGYNVNDVEELVVLDSLEMSYALDMAVVREETIIVPSEVMSVSEWVEGNNHTFSDRKITFTLYGLTKTGEYSISVTPEFTMLFND